MRGIDQRELGRKERGSAEYERQLRRYGYECGPVVSHKLTADQMKQVMSGEKTVEDFIKGGNSK